MGRTKNPERKALRTISPLLPANHNMTPVCFDSKSLVSMTFVCLGIAKLECQISLGISFLSNMSMHDMLKRKICKKKKNQK